MNNRKLPLIDAYPISETPPNEFMIMANRMAGKITPPAEVAHTPMEFAEITARKFFVNGLQMSLERNLGESREYAACKSAMPPLSQVPNIEKYRAEFPHFDVASVNMEIVLHGGLLAPGQILFHGGLLFGWGGVPVIGESITTFRPLSTTLCAGVAGAHANEHKPEHIYVLRVLPSIKTPAFVFNNARSEFLGHELEILFASGASITCTNVRPLQHYVIVEATIE